MLARTRSSVCCLIAALISALIFLPTAPAAENNETPGDCTALLEKWKAISVIPLDAWRVHPAGDFPGESLALDDSSWETAGKGQSWEAGSYWFRTWVQVPASRGGYEFRGARLDFQIRFDGDQPIFTTVFVDALQRAAGEELEPVLLTRNAAPGQKFLIAVKAQASAGKLRLRMAQLELIEVSGRPNVRALLEECHTAEALNQVAVVGQPERTAVIEAARHAVDWAALERGNQQQFDASLLQTRAELELLRDWLKSFSIDAVGNAHIDMAWLWPWTETVEVTRNTFASVLRLMQEFPDFTFAHSSARAYAWMEEKYPALFEEIRRRVKEGRWEIVGGMWVEPDLNLPDGESLVRQLLLSKRYFQEKFGVDVRVGWNPDSFGYNWQLPQIYKRAGVDYFVTQKLGWNDTNKFPHKLFWWEAPDGSRVLTFFPHDYVNTLNPVRMADDLADAVRRTGLNRMLHLYGVGDHGGGPTRQMLESHRRWQSPSALYPRLALGTTLRFFESVQKELGTLALPVWRDELYLEYHRGTYTTQAHTKKNNRRNEALLLNAERFSSLASLLRAASYPQRELNASWQLLLFNQFHDILPGSGIAPVYVDADRDHAHIQRVAAELLNSALTEIAARIDTRGPGVPLVVFNPLAWRRTDVVEAEVRLPGVATSLEVRAPGTGTVPAEVVSRDPDTQRVRFRFLARALPSLGYKVFHVVNATTPKSAAGATSLLATRDTLENEFLRLRIDLKSGCITSLFDKASGRERLAPGACGNLLQAFRDKPRDWDAWNIDADLENEKWDLDQAETVELVEQGPVRAAIRVVKKFGDSRFTQDITLYAGIPRADIRTEADWHEEHVLLKAAFPVAARSDFAAFEIPYGSIQRPTTRRTPEEQAKFEVPALRWADLSDASGGLSLLNDSKYGYDAKGNVLRLSLLRSPTWPDPNADRGHHQFTYSLYPHAGSWIAAGTVERGYELNYPLLVVAADSHAGSLPASYSFATLAPENVILTALKRAEDDDSWLVRFYEYAGRETLVRLRLPGAVRAWETDLMEKDERPLEVQSGEILVPTRPYEIKTVRVEWKFVSSPSPRQPSSLRR